jgi:hypothetical protein
MLATESALTPRVTASASAHGLQVLSSEPAVSFSGAPTTRFTLALPSAPASTPVKTLQLELSDAYDLDNPAYIEHLDTFLKDTARRLLNPIPAAILTLGGIPLTYSGFAWPFHESTAGADTSVVHGQVTLAAPNPDGSANPLLAKIAAAMTVTFREFVKAPEQPFAESFILNAVRKTLDQGQLELVKSGNRQPVPVTTRYFSPWRKIFIFNDTTEPQRRDFLAAKAFWFSSVHGGNAPIWLADPQDAQYLNATPADLRASIAALANEGLVTLAEDAEFAIPTPALAARAPEFQAHLTEALAFIKPTFNEDMRHGHTNM